MNKHRNILFAVTVVAVALAVLVTACGQPAAEAPSDGKKKVAVLFPGVVTDDSWNQRGYEGLQQAENECNVEGAYTEEVAQDEQVEVMRTYAAEGYNIIIGHGGEYVDAAETVAAEYPDVQFVVSNGTVAHDNLSAFLISYSHQGYLAGLLACEMSETGKAAVVVGEPIPAMEQGVEGFALGAKSCGTEVATEAVYTASWSDVAKAREASLALISGGVDVLWHLLDAADAGVFSAAEDEGVMVMGSGFDQAYLAPEATIGSTLASQPALVYEAACGNVPLGEVKYQDITNYVSIMMADTVPEEAQKSILDVVEKVKSGEIELAP
jgi:basic membrane protein A